MIAPGSGRDLATLAAAAGRPLFADEIRPDDWVRLGSVHVPRREILDFATRWDPLPIHIDEDAARTGPFGDIIACTAHSIAVFSQMVSRDAMTLLATIAGKQMDGLRLPRPLRPDSTVTGKVTITEVSLRDGRADVRWHGEMVDQDCVTVMEMDSLQVLRRSP